MLGGTVSAALGLSVAIAVVWTGDSRDADDARRTWAAFSAAFLAAYTAATGAVTIVRALVADGER
jgi:hypothetical protein